MFECTADYFRLSRHELNYTTEWLSTSIVYSMQMTPPISMKQLTTLQNYMYCEKWLLSTNLKKIVNQPEKNIYLLSKWKGH